MKLYELTKLLLEQYEPLRSDDKKLLWATWNKMGLVENESISKKNYYRAPSSESVTRARRKVQENSPELQATKEVKKFREDIQNKKGTHVYREKVVVPHGPHFYFDNGVAYECNCQIGENH